MCDEPEEKRPRSNYIPHTDYGSRPPSEYFGVGALVGCVIGLLTAFWLAS